MRLTQKQLNKSKEDTKLHVLKMGDDIFSVMMELEGDYHMIKSNFISERLAKDFILKLRTAVIRENYELFQKNNENG